MTEHLDLGDGHRLEFVAFVNPRRDERPDVADEPRIGAVVYHALPNGGECCASIMFDTPATRAFFPHRTTWAVEQADPLTLSPSLLCKTCGDHGFVRDGRWVRA